MIEKNELIRWLNTLPEGAEVGVDDGGLTLRVSNESAYLEVGGLEQPEFSEGNPVKVTQLIDAAGDSSFIGRSGVVMGIDADANPGLVSVKFDDGRTDGFWPEEIALVK